MISLVAKKKVNYNLVNNMIIKCEQTNIFTNSNDQFVNKLEKYIHDILKIDDSKVVVCTMSGDGALHCLASGLNMYFNKKLKWITQSFTFPSSACGILSDSMIIDIDKDGSLDLNKIKKEDIENIDGIIITNVFGNVCDISKYEKWCNDNNKILLLDNAATAYTFYKGQNSCNYGLGSIISFHHTKPFGFGEGGAIIIDKEYEKIIRIVMNFGIDNSNYIKKNNWDINGSNYKMSEISAIYIYQYLIDNFEKIIKHHIRLYEYILNKKIFDLYPNFSDGIPVVSTIALLDTKFDNLYITKKNNDGLFCRKYYNPLVSYEISTIFYDKIICIPCNLDIDEKILNK